MLQDLFKNRLHLPFSASVFQFTEVEVELFSKYLDRSLIRIAKKRLSIVCKLRQSSDLTVFKSPTDIIRIENLDVPICIVTCNVNEAIEINRLALPSSIYILFDGYDKKLANKEAQRCIINFFYDTERI